MVELDISAELSASITGLTEQLRADSERKLQLAQDVSYIEAPAIQLTSLPGLQAGWGPNTGYVWAVQRMTVVGFGATTDLVTAYRANSPAGLVMQNALYSFSPSAVGAVSTWHPGRTGLILQAEESLGFAGTFTGAGPLIVAIDLIQLQLSKLPYFLL